MGPWGIMPNGFDKNWVRLCAAVDGFFQRHGHWPSSVIMRPEVLDDLREDVFSEETFRVLSSKLELVPGEAPIVAEDAEGNHYSYGHDGFPSSRPSPSAQEWLGVRADGRGSTW